MKIKNSPFDFWKPKIGMFGKFYREGDDTKEGYDSTRKMSRIQRTIREVGLIEKYLKPAKGSKFLDCPCGDGRHSIPLVKKKMNVTAVDINPEMIAFHKLMIKEFGNYLPEFLVMDMRDLEFPDNSFDFVINMFLSFGFFRDDAENEKVAQEFYRVLKPGGKLFLHLDLNYDRVIDGRYFGEENISRECITGKINEISEVYNIIDKRLYGSWTLVNGDREDRHYSIRVYDNQEEFIPLFKRAGFKEVILKDPDKSVFDLNSKETILLATK
jgi:ubiquinone/menaquinone biosynthesis C-methylase UbiE